MKRIAAITLVVVLALVLAAPALAGGKITKSTGKDAAQLIPAFEMFPGTAYDSPTTHAYSGATGKVNMIQPNGNVDVIIAVSADGLVSGATYRAYFDTNGVTQGMIGTAGPWSQMGTFVADEYGHGDWNYTAPAGTLALDDYVYSVFVNEVTSGLSILISENVTFSIVAE